MSRWILFALGSAFFAALTAIFGKLGVETLPSNVAVFIRTAVVLVLAGLVVLLRDEWPQAEQFSTMGMVWLIVSGLATGASWLCYYRALSLAPASQAAPIDKLSVVLVIVFAVLFLGEALTWRTAMGGLLIAMGAILLAKS